MKIKSEKLRVKKEKIIDEDLKSLEENARKNLGGLGYEF